MEAKVERISGRLPASIVLVFFRIGVLSGAINFSERLGGINCHRLMTIQWVKNEVRIEDFMNSIVDEMTWGSILFVDVVIDSFVRNRFVLYPFLVVLHSWEENPSHARRSKFCCEWISSHVSNFDEPQRSNVLIWFEQYDCRHWARASLVTRVERANPVNESRKILDLLYHMKVWIDSTRLL